MQTSGGGFQPKRASLQQAHYCVLQLQLTFSYLFKTVANYMVRGPQLHTLSYSSIRRAGIFPG